MRVVPNDQRPLSAKCAQLAYATVEEIAAENINASYVSRVCGSLCS